MELLTDQQIVLAVLRAAMDQFSHSSGFADVVMGELAFITGVDEDDLPFIGDTRMQKTLENAAKVIAALPHL